MSVTEPNKRPGVCYAFAPNGVELPVIDVGNPAFHVDPAALAAATRPGAMKKPSRIQTMLMKPMLRGSLLARAISGAGAARGAPGEVSAQDKAVARAVGYVDKNFRERITLEHLGRAARYHPTYLSQLFSQQLGMTASEYITRVRLREATRDLHDPTARVADVAIANGFPDVKAFNVAFRRTFGRTPSEYRRCVTDAATAGDEGFRERFVRRSDPFVRAALESFAGMADAPLTGPDLALQCQLAEVSALAQEISARLGHLASQ